jgi:predicted transcriptional regulator
MLETSKKDLPPIEESSNAPDVSDLLASFQKMRAEEQELLETKEDLLAKERDLQSKLVKEIDKRKIAIDVLKSEVQNLENRCKEMSQILGSPSTDSSSATDSSH